MARSKKRIHHHSVVHTSNGGQAKKKSSVIFIAVVFFALLGMGMAFFIGGLNVAGMVSGFLLGATGGYFFGHQIENSFKKK